MANKNSLPLIEEIDIKLSPPDVFEIFKERRHSFFLDSGMDPHKLGRYSFIGSQPFLVMKSRGENITFSGSYKRKKIKGNPATKGCKIIVLTNMSNQDSMARLVKAGVDKYLVKSDYGLSEIVQKVKKILGK